MRLDPGSGLARPGAFPLSRAAGGFTVLEMLMASALFAVVLAAIYMMYESHQSMFLTGEARATAQQNARVALDDITASIRMAGSFHPDPACRAPGSGEALRIATDDTLALHGGYRNPDRDQDCNIYVTYSLRSGTGIKGTTLRKETRRDPWDRGQLVEAPLAENVTRLAFEYFDASGQSIPAALPSETVPACPSGFPAARPRWDYALDGQGVVASGATPSRVGQGSQRDTARTIRVHLTVETNIAYDAASGCFRRDVGGPTQPFTLVSETYVRSLTP